MLKSAAHPERPQPSRVESWPTTWVGLLKRNGSALEFLLGVFEVLVDHGLVVQVKGRPVDLAPPERRKVFLNGFR